MQHSVHWDYADSFSGRDAAYLIAGLDPSSHIAEDAYRAQPVIKKMKDAYYLACKIFPNDPKGNEDERSQWQGPHRHQRTKGELLSLQIEDVINNFISSRFFSEGHLKDLEGLDRYSYTFDSKHEFPDAELYTLAESELAVARSSLAMHWMKLSPDDHANYFEAKRKLDSEEKKHANYEISFDQFFESSQIIEAEIDVLRSRMNEKSRTADPSFLDAVNRALAVWDEISKRESNWYDAKSLEEETLYKKVSHLRRDAFKEFEEWKKRYIHEFEEQRFSRSELNRWISENNYPSVYAFSPRVLGAEKPLSTNERNTLLLLVAALTKHCGINIADRNAATMIGRLIDSTGASVTPETIRKYLDAIPDVVARRSK